MAIRCLKCTGLSAAVFDASCNVSTYDTLYFRSILLFTFLQMALFSSARAIVVLLPLLLHTFLNAFPMQPLPRDGMAIPVCPIYTIPVLTALVVLRVTYNRAYTLPALPA
jgi:hypothetical protein